MFPRFSLRHFCAAVLAVTAATASASDLVIKTDSGKVQGKVSSDGQAQEFLGIPYAAPPVGSLRWKAPQPSAKWKGKRQATAFGSRCVQQDRFDDMVFRDPGESEDCLTLNVWRPAAKSKSKLPVMVWIYGGGFTGVRLPSHGRMANTSRAMGVIVVSMNYRLGIFGFLATSALAAEDPHQAAGNYGLMDESAAIQWVHRNAAAFGGDPANVTIFGESAGSFAVSAQMASPLSKGLFAHAIGESGGAFASKGLSFAPLKTIAPQYEAYLQKETGDTSLTALRALSTDQVLKLGRGGEKAGVRFGPDVDGYFLTDSVPAIFASGQASHVPLIAGWNQDEGTSSVVEHQEEQGTEGLHATAIKDFADRSADFLQVYQGATNEEATRAAEDYAGDKFLVYSTWAWLEAQVKSGAPAYRYLFAQPNPGDPFHPVSAGAFHSDEIEYVFGNLDLRPAAHFTPDDYKVSALMQKYWTNFAKTGNPNGTDAPQWPVYDAAGNWQVMRLSPQPAAQADSHRARYLFLQQIWEK